jgi:hypothetical protein
MSAHAYIQWADVPQPVIDSSRQRTEYNATVKLISFVGCPLTGQIDEKSDGKLQVEFPFPPSHEIRNTLIDWLEYWGIHFTVVM